MKSMSPEKCGYKKEQTAESLLQQQKSFKAIKDNLLSLVKDLDQGSMIRKSTTYEKVPSFKIHLKKTNWGGHRWITNYYQLMRHYYKSMMWLFVDIWITYRMIN